MGLLIADGFDTMPAVPPGELITVHVVYMDPPRSKQPIQITLSNPGSGQLSEDPEHPGDPAWARLVTAGEGTFVINATDGLLKKASEEFIIADGVQPWPEVRLLLDYTW